MSLRSNRSKQQQQQQQVTAKVEKKKFSEEFSALWSTSPRKKGDVRSAVQRKGKRRAHEGGGLLGSKSCPQVNTSPSHCAQSPCMHRNLIDYLPHSWELS